MSFLSRRTGVACLLAGPVAVGIYFDAVVMGAWLTPGYSHLADPIIGLMIEKGAGATIVTALFAIYNALLAVFALGLAEALSERDARYPSGAPGLVLLVAASGIGLLAYPMDAIGTPGTLLGAIHIALAATASVGSMLAMLSVAYSLATASRALAIYSLASMQAVFASGAFAAVAAAWGSPMMGLAERITIAAFLQWILVLWVALRGPFERSEPSDRFHLSHAGRPADR